MHRIVNVPIFCVCVCVCVLLEFEEVCKCEGLKWKENSNHFTFSCFNYVTEMRRTSPHSYGQ